MLNDTIVVPAFAPTVVLLPCRPVASISVPQDTLLLSVSRHVDVQALPVPISRCGCPRRHAHTGIANHCALPGVGELYTYDGKEIVE